MKKILTLLLSIMLLSCVKNENSIPLIIYNNSDPFIRNLGDEILNKSAKTLNIARYDSQNFQINQNELIDNLINDNVKLIILNPVDRLGVYPIIKKLKSKNVPVIFFNREPLEKDLKLWSKAYYVGTKSEQAAIIQAELIETLFNTKEKLINNDRNGNGIIDILLLKGEQGHQDAEIRTKEVLNTLKNRGYKINTLSIEVANWNRDQAYEGTLDSIQKYRNDIDIVISNNDEMAIGAIEALIEEKLILDSNRDGLIDRESERWIPVVGIDGLNKARELINQGYLYGTVVNDAELQAKAIAELAEFITNNRDLNELSYPLIDNKYILINYKILQKK